MGQTENGLEVCDIDNDFEGSSRDVQIRFSSAWSDNIDSAIDDMITDCFYGKEYQKNYRENALFRTQGWRKN